MNYKLAAVVSSALAITSAISHAAPLHTKQVNEPVALQESTLGKRFYVRANVNFPVHSKLALYKTKNKIGGQIAAGWAFHQDASAEVEVSNFRFAARRTDPINAPHGDNRKVRSWVGFLNIVAHPASLSGKEFKGFIGGGIGYARHNVSQVKDDTGLVNTFTTKKTSGSLAYQLFLGVEWMVRPSLSFLVDARWVGLGKAKVSVPSSFTESHRLNAQTLTLGVKYKF